MEIDWSAVDRWIMGESWVGSRVSEHLQILTDRLAPRWAGSDGERQTIDYLVDQWRGLNLNQPRSENFSFNTWDPGVAHLTVKGDDCWKAEIRPFLFCPPASINAPLVDVGYGMPHELEAIGARLSGAIAICNSELEPFSPARTFPNRVQDIANAGGLAIVSPNRRLAPRWTSYQSAHDWRDGFGPRMPIPVVQTTREDGARLQRSAVAGVMVAMEVLTSFLDGESANTVAELSGERWPDEHIVLGAHHDTVPTSFGADDNGSGTVVALEVARVLSKLQREQGVTPGANIRFVTFGAEEQFLQGSFAYVKRHHGPEQHPRIMVNLDQLGTGNMKGVALQFPELRQVMEKELASMNDGLRCHVIAQLDSSGDMFPFTLAGIPSAILWRWRFVGAYPETAFGHSSADTIDKLKTRELKEYVGLLSRFLLRLSHIPPDTWPENRLNRREIAARNKAEQGATFSSSPR